MSQDFSGAQRFGQAMQRGRGVAYVVCGSLALVFTRLGAVATTFRAVVVIAGIGALSAVGLGLYYRLRTSSRWDRAADTVGTACDITLITISITYTGGSTSPWFIWYLSSLAASAFVGDLLAIAVVTLVDVAAYLGALFWMGEITGVDNTLYLPLMRIVFLHTAALFFLLGVVDLKRKRLAIKALKEEESRKVVELRRLSAAHDERTRELGDANVRIRESSRLKSRFLATMSHELRTPLNSIIGFSEILLNRLSSLPEEKQRRFLQNILGSGQHLLGLINDILDLSKIESGRMELAAEPLAVAPAIGNVVAIMKGMSEPRGVSVVAEVPDDLPPLEADPVRFKQILFNLASNAVKFSPSEATVTITARRLPAEGSPLGEDSLEVAVRDHGIGIDPKDHELVFQEFRQADDGAARRHEGTGLGLALVKRFVEMHGGVVGLISALGAGSTFTVTLPLRFRRGAAVPSRAPRAGGHEQRLCVVVVEDDAKSYESISEPLVAAGYLPVRAKDGAEAAALIRSLRPAAITLDLGLPGVSGWEVLKEIKSDPATARIPVVIVSMSGERELGLALGVDEFLQKPVDSQRLVERLGELVPWDRSASAATVLLIDDDPAVHTLLDEALTQAGYRLLHASSGAEGLELVTRGRPDLVVLDLMMEGMDGFEVARRLKSDPSTSSLPVLVLTSKELTAHDRDLLRGRIAARMEKGRTSHAELVACVGDLLSRRSATPSEAGDAEGER